MNLPSQPGEQITGCAAKNYNTEKEVKGWPYYKQLPCKGIGTIPRR